ncbi:MAG: BMP family ABC transporter substrate-binding protein [Candidatus Riflebacteria bacterium]|nr:BMP family ABC transporter substrate-binding protein [Candidatus Riflebacteria bacterium]
MHIRKSVLRFFRVGLLIACSAFVIFIAGCSDSKSNTADKQLRIGIVVSPQGLSDRGFNEMANAGMKAAEKQFGAETVIIEPSTMNDYETSLRFFTAQKFDAIIAVGMGFIDSIRKISKERPDLLFFIVDSDISEGNVKGISFREEEGSILCGYLAASVSKTKKIGFIGGVKIPVVQRFLDGYKQGASLVSTDTQVIEKYVSEGFKGFNQADVAKEIALEMFSEGCDVIFHAAGGSGQGVISAAVETKKFVIGADMNQDGLAPGLVLTSMVKRVDLVVENVVKTLHEGKSTDSIKFSYGISDGAIDLTDFQFTRNVIGEELIAKLNVLKQEIYSGKRKINRSPEPAK